MSTYPGGYDPAIFPEPFSSAYRTHLQHLKLKGLQPKTIDAYARAIRRMGDYSDFAIDKLSPTQLTHYFSDLVASHSWSAVKLDLYGFKFFTLHVLGKPWSSPNFIKPPKVQRLPDIVTVEEAQALFAATRVLSYRVFFFTLYSMGLRLSEGLALNLLGPLSVPGRHSGEGHLALRRQQRHLPLARQQNQTPDHAHREWRAVSASGNACAAQRL